MAIIEAKNLTKEYKTFKLNDVSFKIEEGTIVGFIGENGAGKSTTLKILANINRPTSGEALIFSKEVGKLSWKEREDISFLLDELNFPDNIKVFQLGNVLKNIYRNWNKDLFEDYLKKFELDRTKKIGQLSKGMKVKLNFAVAFSHNAKVLILDEPTNGLDPIVRDEMLDILSEFAFNGGTVFVSSHIVDDLERVCSRIIFIHKGNIIMDNDKKTLLSLYDLFELNEEEWEKLDKTDVIRYKRSANGMIEVLALKDKYDVEKKNITLNDIMIMIVRGVTL